MEEVHWLDDREQRAWRSFLHMHLRLTARMSHDLAATSDLSSADYMVLAEVTNQPEGRMRVLDLARQIGWEKSRLSHHVNRMVERGLVTKEKCPEDRRAAYVAASGKGLRKIAAAAPGHVTTVRRYFVDRLTAEQIDTLAEVAATVLDALDSADPDLPD